MSSEAVCGYTEEVSSNRFVYINLAGVVAFVGFVSNLLLLYVFCARRPSNRPFSIYSALLALLDSILCFIFLLIFVVDVNMIYLRKLSLFVIYHKYIVYAFGIVKIVQFLIPYMLMLATLERYNWIENRKKTALLRPRDRYLSLGFVLFVSIVLRTPSALALTVTVFPNCIDPFRQLAVDLKDWAKESYLYTAYDVYGISFLQTFLPFLILMVLNLVIVSRLARIDHLNRNGTSKTIMLKKRRSVRLMHSINITKMPSCVRNAVFTMVIIVSTYLVSNSLHILLTLLEVSKASILTEVDDPYKASSFYTILGDVVSLLYMTSSAIRIVIYMKCNHVVRNQILSVVQPKRRQNMLLRAGLELTYESFSTQGARCDMK